MCNFTTYGGCTEAMPPEKAFDPMGYSTRTSLGDTHLMGGGTTAQVVGDTFTFDMQGCAQVGRIAFYSGGGPPNYAGYDTRDYPGALDVTVSGDCTTSAQGAITGTFGAVVATGTEPQPGCSGGSACSMPFTINFAQPTAARCVSMKLTKLLKLGGGIWWAISDLNVYP
jgi:hypothetical protein